MYTALSSPARTDSPTTTAVPTLVAVIASPSAVIDVTGTASSSH
jgi:hypothetical protein